MSDSPFPSDEGGTPSSFRPISFWRLAYKELRETLRDRRTLLTLFLMPLIVYPILSLLLQSFFLSGLPTTPVEDTEDSDRLGANEFAYVFEEQQILNEVAPSLNQAFVNYNAARDRSGTKESNPGNLSAEDLALQKNLFAKHSLIWIDPEQDQDMKEMLANGNADVGVLIDNRLDADGQNKGLQFTLLYLDNDVRSLKALALMENILNYNNISTYQTLLKRFSGRRLIREPVSIKTEMIELKSKAEGSTGISFAAIIPLILTLMTITGAVYPAIDLTAGERERGTLESMIAAPIPRMRILLGKLVAIISVAMLTAIVNLLGMSITLWVFRLDTVFLGDQGLSVATAIRVLGLLILFAAFFSSVLLVITSFARSFKEGQAYLIPVVMVALAPSLMSLKPDLQLTGIWTVTPLVNIVLLARDVLDGSADWRNAIITVLSTAVYSLLALSLAARFFGTANVLYGQDQGIGKLFKRPHRQQKYASLSLGMLCLACLFPATFIWNGVLARTAVVETSGSEIADAAAQQSLLAMQLWLAAAGLVIVFLLIPWAITAFHRVRFRSGFGISKTSAVALIAGVMMGIGFGPLLLQVISWSSQALDFVGLSDEATSDLLVQRGEQYVERIKQAPIWMLLLSMAIVPAICEELFFRGLLFRSFRTHFSPWKTIFATAILFGSFHLISSSGLTISRFLPTTIMGVILGWVGYRSGSVLPGILLHALHNAITVCFAYYRDDLIELGRITAEQENVPSQVLVIGAICAMAGVLLLRFFSKPPEVDEANSDVVLSG